MARDDSYKLGLYLIAGGSIFYYMSFVKYKLRRRMSDIPRSKIGSAAIGTNVEVHGKVLNMAEDGVKSPLSGKQGAAFIWKLEEYVKRGKNSSWEHRYSFYSTPYLYIHDGGEHTAAIDLSACEFQENLFNHTVAFDSGSFDLPEKVKNILSKSSMLDTSKTESFFFKTKFRLQEKVFAYEQPLYVLGAAIPCPNKETPMNPDGATKFGSREIGYKRKISAIFNRSKTDRATVSKYDSNNNQTLDATEQAALMKDIEAELLAEHGKSAINEYVKKAKLLFTTDDSSSGPFKLDKVYISTKSETDLNSSLMLQGLLGLVGGPIMIAIGLYILIF